MTAQLLAWAGHTHAGHTPAGHTTGLNLPLECRTLTSVSGKAPCPIDNRDNGCTVCWSHAASGAVLTSPDLVNVPAPTGTAERFTCPTAAPAPHRTYAAYSPRGPPVPASA